MVVEPFGVDRLDSGANPLVQRPPPLRPNGAIRDLQGQRMLEGVLDVGQRWLLVDELPKLQIAEYPFQFAIGLAGDLPYKPERKLLAHYGQRLEQILFVGRQPVDTSGEDRLHCWRDAQFAQRPGQFDRSVADQRSLVEENLHGLLHEERIAM